MKYIQIMPRILLGFIYFASGIYGLLMSFGVVPMPPQDGMAPAALAFSSAMMATGYFFPVLKVTETFFGLLLLVNKCTPLALVVLAPVTIHIFLFHFMLTPGEWLLALVMVLVHLYLGFQNRKAFKPLFQ